MLHPRIAALVSTRFGPPWPAGCAALLLAVVLVAGLRNGELLAAGQLPNDPVERFRQALRLEQRLRNGQTAALNFRRKNLERAAADIQALGDLSRALLLLEWQVDKTDVTAYREETEARAIEAEVRQGLTQRFIRGVRAIVAQRNQSGTTAQEAAVANLVGETMVSAGTLGDERLTLYRELAELGPELAKLLQVSQPSVQQAAARALADFPTEAQKTVVPALGKLLADRNADPQTRAAAATALGALVQVVSERDLNERPSEPGVMARSRSTGRSRVFNRFEQLTVYSLVVPEVARGLSDPSADVRRASIDAVRQVSAALVGPPGLIPRIDDKADLIFFPGAPFPSPERKNWDPQEVENVRKGRDYVRQVEDEVRPVLSAFEKQTEPIVQAAVDPDGQVRLQARRVLEDLAFTRQALERLRSFVPELPKDLPTPPPSEDKDRTGRLDSTPRETEPTRSTGAVAESGIPLALPPARPVTPGEPAPAPVVSAVPVTASAPALAPQGVVASEAGSPRRMAWAAQKQGADAPRSPERTDQAPLRRTLTDARVALIRQGLNDPDPASRRALIDVLEMMGSDAIPAIPALVEALGDRDLFVRWAAARTLGRLAPEGANQTIEPLARLLCDTDLDVRLSAANALIRYGPDARAAVDALGRAVVSKSDAEFRLVAMQALEAIGAAAAVTVPALTRSLRDPNPQVRATAARVIGRFGRQAADAVPALREALGDRDGEVRKAASEAILQILPPP